MDFINILFNKSKPFTPVSVPGGSSNGRVMSSEKLVTFGPRLQESEKEMLQDDVEITRRKLKKNLESTGETYEDSSDCDDNVYTKYKFDQRTLDATQLPIYASKNEILSKIANYSTVIIEGSTGCGKSTQIPQMILDDARANQKPCNIIVTQPRRIAARSIAERVSLERGWDLGSLVGYQIGLDKKNMSEDTRVLFCTTGVLLEKLIQVKSLSQFTHIVLDEVHERDKDMDFLFIIIRMLLAKDAVNVKIVLMSATINSNMFADYFEIHKNGQWQPAPIVRVDKKNFYTVKEFYLDDFEQITPDIRWEQPGISDEMYKLVLTLIRKLKNFGQEKDDEMSSVLVFLPGIYEIGRMRNYLTEFMEIKSDVAWKIYILHSLVSTEEQQSIFRPVEEGVRKIILSTNIAESSITVPDVKYVIDFCLLKYLKRDSTKNFTSLEMDWASRNNCRQRLGRAGRVTDGRCYRLVTRRFFTTNMRESAIPELLLAPLENVILKAKTFDMESPHVILGLAMKDSVPKMDEVANTVLILKELGAMQLTYKNEGYSPIDGDLTFLGRVMSSLPIDVHATRLIAIGFSFGILEECVIMAAGLTAKSIFKISFDKNLSEYSRRLEWSNGSGSDLFAILNAYRVWTLKYNQKEFGRSKEQRSVEREFCNEHFLDVRSLHECHQLVQELTQRLDKLGICQESGVHGIHWTDQEKCIILKVAIAGAFYPNFFTTAPINNPMIERDVFHVLNGRDPNDTVFFTGFRHGNIRELYVEAIRDVFADTVVKKGDIDSVKVSFETNSEKVFITFDQSRSSKEANRNDWDTQRCTIPGKTLTEVYKAVKMRQMNLFINIGVMKPDYEKLVAEKVGLGISTGSTFTLKKDLRDEISSICIPNITKKEMIGTITHIENCSKFWLQPTSEKQRVEEFKQILNENADNICEPCMDYLSITREEIIVARDHIDNQLYRARMIAHDNFTTYDPHTVSFIDYGRTQRCQVKDLYIFKCRNDLSTTPPRCFECRLAEVQPSNANLSGGNMWDSDAIDYFRSSVKDCEVKAEIYSIVNGVVNVFILVNGVNFNNDLIERNYGEFCEENFLSISNHCKRERIQESVADEALDDLELLKLDDCDEYFPIADVRPMAIEDRHCARVIRLRGPISPLETKLHSMLVESGQTSITIDRHSVNSVFLTSVQQDLSLKYMVATHISKHGIANDKGFTIHETTLLPSIRGFGALMAMIFCPAMDLKRDEWKSRYISVRTGLGFNEEKKCPYFAEHDAVFPLDFQLDADDLGMINQMRYCMGTMLFSFNNTVCNDTISVKTRLELMRKLKDVTLKLLTKKRKAIEINPVSHEWREYEPDEIKPWDDVHFGKSNFPPHGLLCLHPIDNGIKIRLKKYCADLHNLATSMPRPIMCKLCATQLENVTMLRTHLMTRLHKAREEEVGFICR